jgi:serine/threonine protein kinase
MPLQYPNDWRFSEGLFPVPDKAVTAVERLVEEIVASASDPKTVYETVKHRYGHTTLSSNVSWAEADMGTALRRSMGNAPAFVDKFWMALEDLQASGHTVPSHHVVNQILGRADITFRIEPPRLVQTVNIALAGQETPPASALPHYTLGQLLGEGGFGEVFEARRDTGLGSFRFAIKFHSPSNFVKSPEKARMRFEREVQALQKLQHRGIVQYLDAGFDASGRPFLAMPYVMGQNLANATPAWDVEKALGYMLEVATALAYAHSNNVLHRDLKPSNILVRAADNQPIILDFGLAYLFDESDELGLTTSGLGTNGYVPREVLDKPTLRTPLQDVYACGVILYELLCGTRPSIAWRTYRSLAKQTPSVPKLKRIDRLIKRTIAPFKDEGRIKSANELRDELRKLAVRK